MILDLETAMKVLAPVLQVCCKDTTVFFLTVKMVAAIVAAVSQRACCEA